MMECASEMVAKEAAERLTSDPAITVADLEGCLRAYMDIVGYRNIQEIVDAIVESKCTWKSSPKAEG
jgi:hypothetical protein